MKKIDDFEMEVVQAVDNHIHLNDELAKSLIYLACSMLMFSTHNPMDRIAMFNKYCGEAFERLKKDGI